MGKKGDKERTLFGRCVVCIVGMRMIPHILGEVRDRGSRAGGGIHGCRVRKGGLFCFCVRRGESGGGLVALLCLHWDGCETASLPSMCGVYSLVCCCTIIVVQITLLLL